MGGVKRSRTAQAVAAERAVLHRMGVLDDPFAQQLLEPLMRRALWVAEHLPAGVRSGSITLAGLAGRVSWFDAQVTAALDGGITQVAVVGAGYDSRAWRFARAGVRFFELDHPATQQDKVSRAPAGGPAFVPADLTAEDAATALAAGGMDLAKPALFVIEGVTMYLSEEVLRRQVAGLAAASSSASRLAIDFYPPPTSGSARNQRQLRLQRLTRAGSGEGFQLQIDQTGAVGLLEDGGWAVTERVGLRAAAQALVSARSGLRVDDVNDAKSLIAAQT